MNAVVAAFLLIALGADAASDTDAKDPARSGPMERVVPLGGVWVKQGASLLFYDANGTLAVEIPLLKGETSGGARVTLTETRAGVSPRGRFAWVLERTSVWNIARTKQFEGRAELRFMGGGGQLLWRHDADAPDGSDPLVFSADGETLALASRDASGWTASARSYLGATLAEAGPFPRLELIALTPNGRYLTARWSVPDESATHTFIEVATRRRVDIASKDLLLGLARIDDDGNVLSGKKSVYGFSSPQPAAP